MSGNNIFVEETSDVDPGGTVISAIKDGVAKNWIKGPPGQDKGLVNSKVAERNAQNSRKLSFPWFEPASGFEIFGRELQIEGDTTFLGRKAIRAKLLGEGPDTQFILITVGQHYLIVYSEVQAGSLRYTLEVKKTTSVNGLEIPTEFLRSLSGPAKDILLMSGGELPKGRDPESQLAFVHDYTFANTRVNEPIPPSKFDIDWTVGTNVIDEKAKTWGLWREGGLNHPLAAETPAEQGTGEIIPDAEPAPIAEIKDSSVKPIASDTPAQSLAQGAHPDQHASRLFTYTLIAIAILVGALFFLKWKYPRWKHWN
jgi:hypothetical protein